MTEELYIVRRHNNSDGVERQARTQPTHNGSHSRRKLAVGLIVFALCAVAVTATLVNYLSTQAITSVTVTSPITLDTSGWTFNTQETHGGSAFDLTSVATNAANVDINGVADIWVNCSTDGGTTWSRYDFIAGGGGITITQTAPSADVGLLGNSNHDMRFPAAGSTTFSHTTTTTLTFHVAFATDIQPNTIYQFNLVIRPSSWTPGP